MRKAVMLVENAGRAVSLSECFIELLSFQYLCSTDAFQVISSCTFARSLILLSVNWMRHLLRIHSSNVNIEQKGSYVYVSRNLPLREPCVISLYSLT